MKNRKNAFGKYVCIVQSMFFHSCFQLIDHKDFSEVHSEHVKVCAKMRSKLTSEVRENIRKLKVC